MKYFSFFGVNDFVICLGYKGYSIKEYLINYSIHLNDIEINFDQKNYKNLNSRTERWNIKLIETGLNTMTGGRIKKIEIFITSDIKVTEIIIRDDGPGFPKDLIDKHRLGEPYIRTVDQENISKYGLGLGTFIGKTLLEKNFATVKFQNSIKSKGAEVLIKWENKDLKNI